VLHRQLLRHLCSTGLQLHPGHSFISLNTALCCRAVIMLFRFFSHIFTPFIAFITLFPSLFCIFFVLFYILTYFFLLQVFYLYSCFISRFFCILFYLYFPPHLFSAPIPFARSKTSLKASPMTKSQGKTCTIHPTW
jgi:hypothetical protein